MRRNLVVMITTLVFVCSTSFVFYRLQNEWSKYLTLSNIADKVLVTLKDLRLQINQVAITNNRITSPKPNNLGQDLFYVDSISIKNNLNKLTNTVVDSLNKKIAFHLNRIISSELNWIINNNVRDSLILDKPSKHTQTFQTIERLITISEARTQTLINYHNQKLNDTFHKVIVLLLILSIIYLIILLYVYWNYYRQTQEKQTREEHIIERENYFKKTMDNMLEGIQIFTFDYRYFYVNDVAVQHSSFKREEILGKTLMEKYPGIENTHMFSVFKKCMEERCVDHIDTEFVFPNGKKSYFELNIQPVPEGLLILSVDITEKKKNSDDLLKLNRLYGFLSAINQTIVHSKSIDELAQKVTKISLEIGQFKLSYLGLVNENQEFQMLSVSGNESAAARVKQQADLKINDPNLKNIPTVKVVLTGVYQYNNDMQGDPALQSWKKEFEEQGIFSSISLPITMFGKVVGVLGFHSGIKNFFDTNEIALLEEAAGDISFAFENFENQKKQKEIEELAANNDKRYRAMIEKSFDLKTLTNKDGDFIYCSPSVLKVFGYSENEIIGKAAKDFFHPDDIPDMINNITNVIVHNGSFAFFQGRLLHKNGYWIWCEGTVSNFLNDPAIGAIITNFMDISARKKLEIQQEFDKNNLDAIINNTNDLMWSIDPNYKLITFNKPFKRLISTRFKAPILKGDFILRSELGKETIDNFRRLYDRALSGEIFTEIHHTIINGGDNWLEISFYPIKKDSLVIGTACFSRDITKTVKAAAEKEELIRELTKQNHSLRQFAYITSHNLRSPIANLLGLTSLLDMYDLKDETLNKIITGIKDCSLRFDETIKDLSDILTIKENPNVVLEKIKLEEIFEKAISSSNFDLEKAHTTITFDFSAAPCINFNKVYMESVFVNLLTNSIKYRKENIPLLIIVKSVKEADHVLLTFTDNGIGFDAEVQKDKVFQLYQRFHLNKEGKGMGLYLVKTQIESLGGAIEVKSKINEGTTFFMKFKNATN